MNLKKAVYLKKIISATAITALLIYFTIKTPSPKIIFIPFLICGFAAISENVLLLFEKRKPAEIFHKLFAFGVLLFLFGFLFGAIYLSIRDKNYSLLIFSIPFLLMGIFFAKRKIFRGGKSKSSDMGFRFRIIMSGVLVAAALISGIAILFIGISRKDIIIAFLGAFFVFGAMTFVLAALSLKGYFDKFKTDVLGIYMGSFIAIVGIGFIGLKFAETYSLSKTLEDFGIWIAVPVLMIVVGILTVLNRLRNKKK